MGNYSDNKFASLGFGFLAGYLYPCYSRFCDPAEIGTHVIAVTADEHTLEEKRGRYPFPIYLNDNERALRELQPDVAVYPETHPGASRYCTVPEHADVAIGFDAAQLAPDAKFLEFASDIEPFGYETPMRLLEGIKDALAGTEDARAALYSKGLVV